MLAAIFFRPKPYPHHAQRAVAAVVVVTEQLLVLQGLLEPEPTLTGCRPRNLWLDSAAVLHLTLQVKGPSIQNDLAIPLQCR